MQTDNYAKGMAEYSEEQFEITKEYDRYQFAMLKPYLGARVCEIGAGPGRITELVRQEGLVREFTVLEPSPYFHSMLMRRFSDAKNIQIKCGEVGDLGAEYTGTYDTVFSVHVMEHVEDDRAFVKHCLRLLKPGGTLVILVPAFQSLFSNLDKRIGHYRRYDKSALQKLLVDQPATIKLLRYDNFIGVFAWLYFFKWRKLDFQSNQSSKVKFFGLFSIFSKYFVPVIAAVEAKIPPPIGLNLTLVADKVNSYDS